MKGVVWSEYLRCGVCFAPAGRPCWSLRKEHGRRNTTKWPHDRRPRRKPVDKFSAPATDRT